MQTPVSRVCARPDCGFSFVVEFQSDPKKYCSRSCSAKHTNKIAPKRRKSKKCFTCDNLITSEVKYCKECRPAKLPILQRTVGDVIGSASAFIHSQLREVARKAYRLSGQPYQCYNCKYNKHVDICHIKDLWQFEKSDLVADTCSLDNIIALCKNCHWEFDNGYLTINGVKKPWKPSTQADDFWVKFAKNNKHGSFVIGPHWVKEDVP